MKNNKARLYGLEILFSIILFIALLVSNRITYILLAIILSIYAIVVNMFFKKKKILSTNKNQANMLMIGFALIYLGIFYLLGLLVYNFNKSAVIFGFKSLYRYIIPLIVIIVSTEIIRFTFLSQDAKIRIFKKRIDISKIIMFIDMVLIDLVIHAGVYDLTNFNELLTVMGFIFFASVSYDLLSQNQDQVSLHDIAYLYKSKHT